MRNRRHRSAFALVIASCALLVAAAGCKRGEQETPVKGGEVSATAAYVKYFGTPPTVEKGSCFALVGFLPAAGDPARVTPFPLFLFAEKDRMRLLVERLIDLQPAALERAGLVSPFPPGTALLSLEQKGDTIQLDLAAPPGGRKDHWDSRAVLASLGHSLVQFPGVDRIIVTVSGEPFPGSTPPGYAPVHSDVAEPGSPRLLQAAGVWEKGAKQPEEISVFFDRPVKIEEIRLTDREGRRLEGELFQSVFAMAVILRPADPGTVVEGMPVRVAWKVTDFLGRSGEGEETLPLGRVEHP